MFKTSDLNEPATFHERTRTSKLLLEVLESLVPGNLPLPNQHLPTDILQLIFDQVLLLDDPRARRSTIYSLAQTSVAWSKLALPKCRNEVFIDSFRELENWVDINADTSTVAPRRKLELFNLDYEDLSERDAETFAAAFEVIDPKEVHLNLGRKELIDVWWETLYEVLGNIKDNFCLKLPTIGAADYEAALDLLIQPGRHNSNRRELYFNSEAAPQEIRVVEQAFTEGRGI